MSIYVTLDPDNVVISVVTVPNPSGTTVDEVFPGNPEYTASLIQVDDHPNIAVGWNGTRKGNSWSFVSFEESADYIAKDRIQKIADERFLRETAGTAVSGVAVLTDRTTQMKLTAAAVRAQRDASYSVNWKQSDGKYIELSATQLVAIADAVGDYVQACYDREAVLLSALTDGTYADAMLVEGWPT
ncbi:DUF4376 domain-containing protein [Pseudomonas baltica]|uniref:DUF4376 domain-containing protein n=1 Tax=Pseudomonas baltica TaxID=2762576 RepID=UPI0028A20702|nr:DUF4376 domain-containing protein [Pseudomonas baltica]